MEYIVHRRFKGKSISGDVNLPSMSKCEAHDGVIFWNDKPICLVTSENAHQYFARDDDGHGMRRGFLTQSIQKKLAQKDRLHQVRWDIIQNDFLCQRFKRKDRPDYWLWNHDFFGASVRELEYIAAKIGIKI